MIPYHPKSHGHPTPLLVQQEKLDPLNNIQGKRKQGRAAGIQEIVAFCYVKFNAAWRLWGTQLLMNMFSLMNEETYWWHY